MYVGLSLPNMRLVFRIEMQHLNDKLKIVKMHVKLFKGNYVLKFHKHVLTRK